MTDEQYTDFKKTLGIIIDNQNIINGNISALVDKVNVLQDDMSTAIRNQQILGNDQDKLITKVERIERILNK